MYLFFDTETTGLPKDFSAPAGPQWPRLVSLSWALMEDDSTVVEKGHFIVKPDGFTIPEEVIKIHGISTEKAISEGFNLDYVLHEFSKVLNKASLLIAHNIEFDENILASAYIQAGISFNIKKVKQYCTKKQSAEVVKIPSEKGKGYKYPKLKELYKYFFNTGFEGAHSSDHDTEACAKCFFELQKAKVEA